MNSQCTLSDAELIKKCISWIYDLAKTGGHCWSLQVPGNYNLDPDLLFSELADRFKNLKESTDKFKSENFSSDEINSMLNQTLENGGIEKRLNMVSEETGELNMAVNKVRRLGLVAGQKIRKPDASMSYKQIAAYNNLCEEIADCKIVLQHLENLTDPERVSMYVNRKLKRLEDGTL